MSTKRRRPVQAKRRMSVKNILVMAACMALVAVVSISGTIAWLTATTDAVTNTFTASGIDISLVETKAPDGTTLSDSWSAQIIPGKEYVKDPVVTVAETTNVDVYLFVKMDDKTNTDCVSFTSNLTEDQGWKTVSGQTGVYYRIVTPTDQDKSWHLINGDKVSIPDDLTKDKMASDSLTLSYKAYAIQQEGFTTPEDAWAEVSKLDTVTP